MTQNIQIISSNKRPVRAGDQVAPSDGTPITVDLDDPLVKRHLDRASDEWFRLDGLGSAGVDNFVDKTLVGRWSTNTLPGNNSTRVIMPDGSNVAQTSAQCRRGAFVLDEDDIAGGLASGQKLTFYTYMTADVQGASVVTGGNAEFSAGIRTAGASGRWNGPGNVSPGTPDMYPQSPPVLPGTGKYEWFDEADFFVENPAATGWWFLPTFTIQSLGGSFLAVGPGDGFLLEILLYAKVNDV